MAHLEPRGSQPAEEEQAPQPESGEEQSSSQDRSPEDKTPLWLRELRGSRGEPGEDSDLGLELPAASWIPSSPPREPAPSEEPPTVSPFSGETGGEDSEQIPAWLDDALIEEASPAGGEDEEKLEIAEDQAEQDEPQPVRRPPVQVPRSQESAGPLAGLSGVLSAQSGASRIRKPGAYSTKIRVTDSQQMHVDLLQTLLDNEGQAMPLPAKSPISQQHVLRWGIAAVLLVALLWSLILSPEKRALPVYDEGGAEVNRLINQLPSDAQVLVGFDYEPGLSSELDASGAPVFRHLMSQGVLLTLVSTTPNGPMLAERFIQSIPTGTEYANSSDYSINLGYIPGGAAGLASFIENPRGTMPYSIDEIAVWESASGVPAPPVAGIDNISDYEMIILLADDADLARIWIEQLTPYITDPQSLTSLVLVTSAQLEPVVRPYFEGVPQSVNGLVVGLRGGAAYARLVGDEELPARYWDAFGMGTFLAALMIFVGGLAYYVVPELSRSVRGQEMEE